MDVIVPKSLEELLPCIDNEEKRIAAGCTDIIVALDAGKLKEKPLIDINRIEEIKTIYEKSGKVYIGANVPLSDIIKNDIIKMNFPLLVKAIKTIGSPQIRNRATLGGNIANASPSGDSIAVLTLLDASVLLKGSYGEREVPLKYFIKGVGKTELRREEFIEYVTLEKKFADYECYFEKVGLRNAMTISVCSMALLFKREQGILSDIKIAFGAAAPKVIEITGAEEFLKGKRIEKDVLTKAGDIIEKTVSPIDDIRASAAYRRKVCKNLIMRLLEI